MWYHLTDAQFSTVAMANLYGQLVERTEYDPYGRGRHRWFDDVNRSGDTNVKDYDDIVAADGAAIGGITYNSDYDLDLDRDPDHLRDPHPP